MDPPLVLRNAVAYVKFAVKHGDIVVLVHTHSTVTAFLRANINARNSKSHPTVEKLIRLVCIMSAIMRSMVGSLVDACACTHDADQTTHAKLCSLAESTRRMCAMSVEMRRMFANRV